MPVPVPVQTGALDGRLRAAAREAAAGRDPAHDYEHVLRVERSAAAIAADEGADARVVRLAALLHELVCLPKDHPESPLAGERAAERAAALLRAEEVDEPTVARVAYAIRVHPFSRGVAPETLEARVLQDADRLDAIGAVGIARCFATGGALGASLYHPEDPFARRRGEGGLDDKRFSVDHFQRKLLKLEAGLHTATARRLAAARVRFMTAYLEQLEREVGEGP